MSLQCGFKARLADDTLPAMLSSFIPRQLETQYHLHIKLHAAQEQPCDRAMNVGTGDADGMLCFRLVRNSIHPV